MNDRPGDAEYLTALAPPNNSLLTTGEVSGVPLPSEPTRKTRNFADMIRAKLAAEPALKAAVEIEDELVECERQLAEANANLAGARATIKESIPDYEKKLAELQAALDREREKNKNLQLSLALHEGPHVTMTPDYAEELENKRNEVTRLLEQELGREREARLRAVAGAVEFRSCVQNITHRIGVAAGADWVRAELERILAQRSTDTGARLAAVLEEVRKMPCEKQTRSRGNCAYMFKEKEFWCARCQVVDALAMEGK